MSKIISINKMSKRKQKEYYSSQRRDWGGLNPASRIKESKKRYSRKTKHKNRDEID